MPLLGEVTKRESTGGSYKRASTFGPFIKIPTKIRVDADYHWKVNLLHKECCY